jgi:hypothetical protein
MARRYKAGDVKWVAYPHGIARVEIVEKGSRGFVFRDGNKPDNPYIVSEDEEEYVLGEADLCDNPIEASRRVAKMRCELGMSELSDEEDDEDLDDEELDDEDDLDEDDDLDEEDED